MVAARPRPIERRPRFIGQGACALERDPQLSVAMEHVWIVARRRGPRRRPGAARFAGEHTRLGERTLAEPKEDVRQNGLRQAGPERGPDAAQRPGRTEDLVV